MGSWKQGGRDYPKDTSKLLEVTDMFIILTTDAFTGEINVKRMLYTLNMGGLLSIG